MVLSKNAGRGYAAILTVILSLSAGCTKPTLIVLEPEKAAKINQTRVISVISQDEITGEVSPSNITAGTGGGLIFAIMDAVITSSRSKAMEESMSPLRALFAFDFRGAFNQQLDEAAKNSNALKITEVVSTAVPYPDKKQSEVLKSIQENALLTIDTQYRLSTDYRTLLITTTAQLLLKGESKPVYLETFAYRSPELKTEINEDQDENEAVLEVWKADNGAKLRKASLDGIGEIMSQLRQKLLKP